MSSAEETITSLPKQTEILRDVLLGEWEGEFAQNSQQIEGTYRMILRVTNLDAHSGAFQGEVCWPTLNYSTPTIVGKIYLSESGEEAEWTETIPQGDGRVKSGRYDVGSKVLRSGRYVPCGLYRMILHGDGSLMGQWFEPEADGGNEGGTFALQRMPI